MELGPLWTPAWWSSDGRAPVLESLTMKSIMLGVAFAALSFAASSAYAAPAAGTGATDQKDLMKTCNADAKAKDLKGDARKTFMSQCLSGKSTAPATAAATTPAAPATPAVSAAVDQKALMKSCNADAKTKDLKGDARKTFMSSCLSSKTAAPATLATPAVSIPAPVVVDTTPKVDQKMLMKTCNDSAKTQKLTGDARKTFMSQCLSGKTTASSAAPLASPTTAPTAPVTNAVAPGAAAPAGTVLKAGQFSTDTQAKAHCPADIAVWVNTDTKIYHFAGTSDYGKTKGGAYMCRGDADKAGDHAAKNEKAPVH